MIQALLISIIAKKYAEQPQSRSSAARLLLTYALQLSAHHLGAEETRRIVKTTLAQPVSEAA